MGSRRRARILALQTLYAIEFGEHDLDAALKHMRVRANQPASQEVDLNELVHGDEEVQGFASTLVRGVMDHLEDIDELVGQCSTNWKMGRMALIDRNILRMATFELQHVDDVPPRVTLNEAVEIAKKYGTEDSGAFINGILDRIASLANG